MPSNARPFGPERPPVVKPRADYAASIPIAEQIADDDSDAPVLPDVERPPTPALSPVRATVDDLLEQLSANVVDRSALLGLLGETISDLSREQSMLVLSAVVPSTVNRSARQVADEVIAALERYGFWLVIRTTDD